MTLQDFSDMVMISVMTAVALGLLLAWANGAFEDEYDEKTGKRRCD